MPWQFKLTAEDARHLDAAFGALEGHRDHQRLDIADAHHIAAQRHKLLCSSTLADKHAENDCTPAHRRSSI